MFQIWDTMRLFLLCFWLLCCQDAASFSIPHECFWEGGKGYFFTGVVTSLVTPFGFFCVSDGVWGHTEFNLKSLTLFLQSHPSILIALMYLSFQRVCKHSKFYTANKTCWWAHWEIPRSCRPIMFEIHSNLFIATFYTSTKLGYQSVVSCKLQHCKINLK